MIDTLDRLKTALAQRLFMDRVMKEWEEFAM